MLHEEVYCIGRDFAYGGILHKEGYGIRRDIAY